MFDLNKLGSKFQSLLKIIEGGNTFDILLEMLPIEIEVNNLVNVLKKFDKVKIYKSKDGSIVIQLKPIEKEKEKK